MSLTIGLVIGTLIVGAVLFGLLAYIWVVKNPTPTPKKTPETSFWAPVIVLIVIACTAWYFWPTAKVKLADRMARAKQDPRDMLIEVASRYTDIGAGEHELEPGVKYRLSLPTDRKVHWHETDAEAVMVYDPSNNRWLSQSPEPLRLRYDPTRRWIAFKSDRPGVRLTVEFR